MKVLILLFLAGFAASASIPDAWDEVDELALDDLNAYSMGVYHLDLKEELAKKLREAMDALLKRIKEAMEQGKDSKIFDYLMEKMKDLKERMKRYNIEIGPKLKEVLEQIKEKVKEYVKKITDNLEDPDESDVAHLDFNIKDFFKKMKKSILENFDKEKIKERIEKVFGKGSELGDQLLNLLKEKGEKAKKKILDWIDRVLEDKEEKKEEIEARSLKEVWEKIKDYFKDLKIDLQQKFAKFGEWVKEKYGDILDKTKSKAENIKAIAKEFLKHAKDASKEVAIEAREFLRPYKEDLKELWDQVKDAVKDIVNKKE